jgi:tRNA(Ile)-lysidine synthase
MPDAIDQALALSRERALFRRARSVLAAVSGGTDSVALLLLLERLAAEAGFVFTVAHFDHMLRPDSGQDLDWVRHLCATRGIAFLSGEGDVRDVAARQRLGIEETARRMRYQFLSFVAGEKGIDVIATGHTADDQAETVLMRVLRGSGVRGIRGMLPVATVPGGSQKLVRPLLATTREETRAICAAAGITPLEDPTNADVAVLRNRIRHEVMPVLSSINPAIGDALRRLSANAQEAFAPIERSAMLLQPQERGAAGAVFDRAAVLPLPGEALGLVIEREAAFHRLEAEVNATRLKNAASVLDRGAGISRFGAVEVEASSGKVRIGPPLEPVPFEERILNIPGSTLAGQWRVDVSTSDLPRTAGSELCAVSLDGIHGALRVRPLRSGDRMTYHGIERKVAHALANARLPAWDRRAAVAIADSRRVLAVLTAGGSFEADRPAGADILCVRLSQAAPRPS